MSVAAPAELFDMTGKVALVTGASSGIGVEFAETLVAAGATVVLAARRADRLAELAATHERLSSVVIDVADSASIDAAFDTVLAQHGRLDVLVNNAGTTWPGRAEKEPVDAFRSVVEVNVVGLFHAAQRAGRAMLEQGSGSIINIASIHGIVASAPNGQASYCTSKAAVLGLTRELAAQWAERGVRVNALAPGYFPSELTEGLLADEKGFAHVARNTPMARAGRTGELAGALLLLASDAGSFITGDVITIDGGWTAR